MTKDPNRFSFWKVVAAEQPSLRELWSIPGSLQPSKDAKKYWNEIDTIVVTLARTDHARLNAYKQIDLDITRKIGEEGIAYWNSIIEGYRKLSQKEAVERLVKAEKLEEKIKTIRAIINPKKPIQRGEVI